MQNGVYHVFGQDEDDKIPRPPAGFNEGIACEAMSSTNLEDAPKGHGGSSAVKRKLSFAEERAPVCDNYKFSM